MEYEERKAWIELWEAVFGEPPPVEPEREPAARILVQHLPPAPPYEPGRPPALKSRTG